MDLYGPVNEKAIEEDAKWDRFHGIAVSNSCKLTIEQALGENIVIFGMLRRHSELPNAH